MDGSVRENTVIRQQLGVVGHFGERRHRTDFHVVGHDTHTFELIHVDEVDHGRGPLDPFLPPVEAVHAARQHPPVVAVPYQQLYRILGVRRLEELERRDHISDDRHLRYLPLDVKVEGAVRRFAALKF